MIINLTKVKEHGKIRCDMYWPSEVGESINFNEHDMTYQVTLMSTESIMKNLIRRRLQIFNATEEREIGEVIQMNYLSWPDHGAPEQRDYQIIEKLIESIQEYQKKPFNQHQFSPQSQGISQTSPRQSKILFHCSAGIGRTGTMIAIYNIIESLKLMLETD